MELPRLLRDGNVFDFQGSQISIGRVGTLPLQDISVSRNHAHIVSAHSHWQLTDLGSKNGTFHNGNKIPPHQPIRLNPGDQLKFGKDPTVLELEKRGKPMREIKQDQQILFDRPFKRKEGRVKMSDFKQFLPQSRAKGNAEQPVKIGKGFKEKDDKFLQHHMREAQVKQLDRIKSMELEELQRLRESHLEAEQEQQARRISQMKMITEKEKDIKARQQHMKKMEEQLFKELEMAKLHKDQKEKEIELQMQRQAQKEKEWLQKQHEEEQAEQARRQQQAETRKKQSLFEQEKLKVFQADIQCKRRQLEQQRRQIEMQSKLINEEYEQKYKQALTRHQQITNQIQANIAHNSKQISGVGQRIDEVNQQISTLRKQLESKETQTASIAYKNKVLILYANELIKSLQNSQTASAATHNSDSHTGKLLLRNNAELRQQLAQKIQQRDRLKNELAEIVDKVVTSPASYARPFSQVLHNAEEAAIASRQLQELKITKALVTRRWETILKQNLELQQRATFLQGHINKEKASMSELLEEHKRKTVESNRRILAEMRGGSEEQVQAAEFLVEQMGMMLESKAEIILENEEMHQQIEQTFFQMENYRQENQNYAEILLKDSMCLTEGSIVTLLKDRYTQAKEQLQTIHAQDNPSIRLKLEEAFTNKQLQLADLEEEANQVLAGLKSKTYSCQGMGELDKMAKELQMMELQAQEQQKRNERLKVQVEELQRQDKHGEEQLKGLERAAQEYRKEQVEKAKLLFM